MRAGVLRGARSAPVVAMATASALAVAGCAGSVTGEGAHAERGVASVDRPAPLTPARVRTGEARSPAKPQTAAVKDANPTYRPAGGPSEPEQASVVAESEANCANVEGCASVLKAMVVGPRRAWIGRPAPPSTFANGVRLFAYRSLRPSLTCAELAAAMAEVQNAVVALGAPVAGLAPDRAARARSLSVEVADELATESARRCQDQSRIRTGGAPPVETKTR